MPKKNTQSLTRDKWARHAWESEFLQTANSTGANSDANSDAKLARLLATMSHPSLVNYQDEFGRSALHFSASKNAVQKLKLLLAQKALLLNTQDRVGNTPLHLAAISNHWESAQILINAGADLSLKDKNGMSPIDHAKTRLRLITQRMAPQEDATKGSNKSERSFITELKRVQPTAQKNYLQN
jgi:hypothetical protein